MPPKKTVEEKYKKMSQIEHILKKPDSYIGSIHEIEVEDFILVEEHMQKCSLRIVPGLYKIFDEVLVNAIDQYTRYPTKVRNIKITIEDDIISVYNDGEGFDIELHKEHNVYVPELVLGQLLTSSNYDDDEKKITGGKNGYGAKLANIYSEWFTIETVDSTRGKKYIQTFRDHMSIIEKPKISSSKTAGYTKISFKPDLTLFKMKKLTGDTIKLMKRRAYDTSACTSKTCSVYLNGKKINTKQFEDYANLYLGLKSETKRVFDAPNQRWELIVSTAPDDKLEQVSFVNGVYTREGGKHIDYLTHQLAKRLQILAKKKKKDVKIQHIKDNLWIFLRCNIENPSFGSQTKDKLTTPETLFGSTCELDDKFIDKVAKCGVLDRAMALSDFKEKASLSKTDGKKQTTIRGIPKLEDAYYAGSSKSTNTILILTEGDSAKAFAMAGLSALTLENRKYYGVFPLKGKLLNTRNASIKQIQGNDEITNLKKILGLKERHKYKTTEELRYGHVLLLTDQDNDGYHIKGLLINFLHHGWPDLVINTDFITTMATPIVRIFKNNRQLITEFYTQSEFKKYILPKGAISKYYKGLGTNTKEDAKEIFKTIDSRIVKYKWDEKSLDNIQQAFLKTKADDRKIWLQKYDSEEFILQTEKEVTYTDFVDKELKHFSMADNERSIPSLVDGLKPSQRKILFCAFKKNLKTEIKVAQFAGYVSEHSGYHHGEASLHDTIIGMAQNFVGSNNINLLVPEGQFGTRLLGGKDASAPRYIFTYLAEETRRIFSKLDEPILEYLYDDDLKIEPQYYVPTLPLILINGTSGIGTGYSTEIPPYNPEDIRENIKRLLDGKSMKIMKPWFRGFTGKIKQESDTKWLIHGVWEKIGINKVRITELPIGEWTTKYHEFLDKQIEDKVLSNYVKMSDDEKVNIELHFIGKIPDDFEKKFKLVTSISLTNMHLYDATGKIKKYDSVLDIIKEFYDIRLEYYEKRKIYWTTKWTADLDILQNRIRFINEFIEGKLEIVKRSTDEIIQDLEKQKYSKFEDSYNYLLDMSIRSLTKERMEHLQSEHDTKLEELEVLKSKTSHNLWSDEL